MKKLIVLFLVLIFVLVGCSTTETTAPAPTTPGQNTEDNRTSEENEFVFEVNGISIPMHAEAAPILEKLGGSQEYFEAESCAIPGLEKTYSFDGFDLYTYEIEGVDYIAAITILDDTVATKEGVYLYDNKDAVLQTYGDKYAKKLDLYTYTLSKSELAFLIENDEVVSIEYTATFDE